MTVYHMHHTYHGTHNHSTPTHNANSNTAQPRRTSVCIHVHPACTATHLTDVLLNEGTVAVGRATEAVGEEEDGVAGTALRHVTTLEHVVPHVPQVLQHQHRHARHSCEASEAATDGRWW